MKKKCLILFKWPNYLNKYLISKLSKYYLVEHLYISEYKGKNFSKIVNEINSTIESQSIELIFFDVDFSKFINFFFIHKIKNIKKILVTYDDYAVHEMNAITANACDLILCQCPLSLLKYKEKGYEAYWMPPENDSNIFKNLSLKKEIDVLFFGQMRQDRKEILDFFINNGIKVKIVGQGTEWVDEEKLVQLICKSKIILNFSKSLGETVTNYASSDIYKFHYQLKGRLIQSGLCGTLCISEYSPGQELIFSEKELPMFRTKDECLKIVNEYLTNNELLEKHSNQFHSKMLELYEEKVNFEPIYKAINKKSFKKVELNTIPYWYVRIAAKQIIKRNISIFKILISFLQLKEVFKIVKDCDFHIKFLVIIESILNIMWYSVLSIKGGK
jgi:hypothetical protein